jgi:hypothetical protein
MISYKPTAVSDTILTRATNDLESVTAPHAGAKSGQQRDLHRGHQQTENVAQ